MSDHILYTKNLTKKFKDQTAVNNVSLTVPRNSVYGLLGPNGAGKSTTLKMITGIAKPTNGEIYYNDKPWNRECLSEIGALIESPPLYSNLTAYENLLVRTTVLGLPKSRITEVLELAGLDVHSHKKAGQYSTGMKQRLGIALALINNPALLILDEPTNGLDPMGIQELRQLIRSFPGKGITVILSSHLLSEIEKTVDLIGIISKGKLCYEGELPENGSKLEVLFTDIVREGGERK
ncbi:MAG: spaF [Lacrimispora sp.]|nr:spaF [Lacrimispora sp.]